MLLVDVDGGEVVALGTTDPAGALELWVDEERPS
jgi:hypothetical protein